MKAGDLKVGMLVKIKGVRCATNGRIAAQGPIAALLPGGAVVDCGFHQYHCGANQLVRIEREAERAG